MTRPPEEIKRIYAASSKGIEITTLDFLAMYRNSSNNKSATAQEGK